MGNDQTVTTAARVSTGSTKSDKHRDMKLINFLIQNNHMSPFEHVVFTFYVKAPLFVARQWFRHRIASYNEASARYKVIKDEFYIPQNIRINDSKDKQKANLTNDPQLLKELQQLTQEHYKQTYELYQKILDKGIARELARTVLPMGMYTEFFWTVNLRSLFNFFNLRADSHAQWEIQQYALKIFNLIKDIVPLSLDAFLQFQYTGDLLK
jgi:thymidylate synthase (FAD)